MCRSRSWSLYRDQCSMDSDKIRGVDDFDVRGASMAHPINRILRDARKHRPLKTSTAERGRTETRRLVSVLLHFRSQYRHFRCQRKHIHQRCSDIGRMRQPQARRDYEAIRPSLMWAGCTPKTPYIQAAKTEFGAVREPPKPVCSQGGAKVPRPRSGEIRCPE